MKRFWEKVDKRGPDECWEWMAGKTRCGYGTFRINPTKKTRAHRFSWELENGPIPAGLCACHRCDNPACVNPRHIFLGTHAENMKDMTDKNRLPNKGGEKNPNARLTVKEVRLIRGLRGRQKQRVIAERFGISQAHVSGIFSGKAWPEDC